MPFSVEITPSAQRHLKFFRARDRHRILDAISAQLLHEPLKQTAARKPLRPNSLATWELREGDFRIFYDVNAAEGRVSVLAVGVKEHNRLVIEGREFLL